VGAQLLFIAGKKKLASITEKLKTDDLLLQIKSPK
jgi:hypothetical protein